MKKTLSYIYRKAAAIVALTVILVFYFLARQPDISDSEKGDLAKQFKFEQIPLADENVSLVRGVRQVAPSLEGISAWVSSTGAAIALSDLDNDGLANDFCKVDPRTDQVLISPVPTTLPRFQPFTLDGKNLTQKKTIAPMGCIPNDYNEDGRPDILVYYWGRTPIIFMAAEKIDKYSLSQDGYVALEIVERDEAWFTGAASVADIDGDGHLDIVIGNYYQDRAEILDVDSKAPQTMQHSMSRAFNGGQSRILRWSEKSDDLGVPKIKYEEITNYVEVSEPHENVELTHGWTLAIGACDLDGDLLPELYFANDFGNDRLLHNRSRPGRILFTELAGNKGFTSPNSKVVGQDSFKGMGVDFADLNDDGLFDFYVSNIAAEYALQESHLLFMSTGDIDSMKIGNAPYIDESENLGVSRSDWGWDVKMGDFNNDGNIEIIQATGFIKGSTPRWAELHEVAMGNDQLLADPGVWHRFQPGDDLSGGTHNPFFVRSVNGRFYDLAVELGLDRNQVTRGISTADVNGDGRLDFAIANQWDTSFLYLNESVQAGDFLGLHIRLPLQAKNRTEILAGHPATDLPSRAAVGAWVSVTLPNGGRLVSYVDGGNGHSGKRSSDVHFGLGPQSDDANVRVEIHWRDKVGERKRVSFEASSGWHTVLLGEE